MAQYIPEVLITSLSHHEPAGRVMIVSVSVPRGSSVPYFPDRTVWYLFYYTNRDLGDEVIG